LPVAAIRSVSSCVKTIPVGFPSTRTTRSSETFPADLLNTATPVLPWVKDTKTQQPSLVGIGLIAQQFHYVSASGAGWLHSAACAGFSVIAPINARTAIVLQMIFMALSSCSRSTYVKLGGNPQSWRFRLNKWLPVRFILTLVALILCNLAGTSSAQVRGLPDQISDQDFWRMITELSEPTGQYTGDNWISNESTIQDVVPPLKQLIKPGGVYLGVGPEQNFTYMWALQSKIGFIIDIRRQNMLDILLFKTLFEMAPDRADFVSLLFSRRRPGGLNASTSAAVLMASCEDAPKEGLPANMERVKSTLARHKYGLSNDDVASIELIYTTFNRGGPSITAEFSSPGSPIPQVPITYTNLMTAKDRNGQYWSYLSSESAYQYVRELHRKNLIIPLVGDFAGPSTIRKVADYLKERNSTVATFYVSNVEYYLSNPQVKRFQANVATLPIDASSIFIRWAMRTPYARWNTDPNRLVMTLSPISELVDLIKADRAPASFPEIIGATKEPQSVVDSMCKTLRCAGSPATSPK
jgi:hypothetical protein